MAKANPTIGMVERGVPVPDFSVRRSGRPDKYPWDDMAVGDSFKVAGISLKGIRATLYNQTKKRGWKFHVEVQRIGMRVWRIS